MQTLSIDILNPKAYDLLKNLANLELIKINSEEEDTFELTKKDLEIIAQSKKEAEQGLFISNDEVQSEARELCMK
ncbi:MAG: hypothetical protein CSA38_05035 [Flavobacteriales bacterium]|nr:MAG: hypothetical protein CSA38_05035 [Flavobacteriales bacterium]